MASPAVLDLVKLSSALDGAQPAGIDPRSDTSSRSTYYAIKDARNAARSSERALLVADGEALPPPDWRPVLDLGVRILGEQAKDLEIAAYLIEALTRLHGFAGLRDGFRLTRELVDNFWDDLYPLPDEDGLETRVTPLTGLNGAETEGTLINPIARVPLTAGQSVGPFAYSDYQQALAVGQISDEGARSARLKQGAVSLALIERAVQETPASFFSQLLEDLMSCLDEFALLEATLNDKCGPDAPPTSSIRSALVSCKEAVQFLARDKLAAAPSAEPAQADGSTGVVAGLSSPAESLGALRDRESAFQTLLKVADFFRRTEPHSPVSYALEQAVRWGRMSLPELIAELIPEEGPRLGFYKQVGIRPPAENNG